MTIRSIWNGSIAFGMVDVPVKVLASTESHDAELHQVHLKDAGRVRYQKRCTVCDAELQQADIGKGYTDGNGKTIVLTEDELAELVGENDKTIEVLDFVPANRINPLMVEKIYYLQPGGGANKVPRSYRLLVAAMQKTKREAVVRFTLRSAQRMGVLRILRVGGVDVLGLHMLFWADEVRDPTFAELKGRAPFKPAELAAAITLVESLAADWDPQAYVDTRQVDLQKMLANPRPARKAKKKLEPVVEDLISKLEESAKKRKAA